MSFSASAQEQQLIKAVFAKADTSDLGVVTGDEAVKVFAGSGLPPTVLGEIWQLSDTDNNGFLTENGLGIALRLIGWAQAGEKPKKELTARVGPLPTIKGIPIPGVSSNPGSPLPLAPSLPARPAMPQLTPDDRQKFLRMFFQSGPANGMLSGEKARDLFLRSKLPTDKLGQIWNLADTHERGSLDATDFVIGMFLIQSVMSGQLSIIPPSLPPGLYEQASGGAPRPTIGSPLQAQFTGNSTGSRPGTGLAQRAASPIRAQFTGQQPLEPQYTGSGQRRIVPQYTGQSNSAASSALRPQLTGQPFAIPQPFGQSQQPKWDVTPEEKAKADTFFATLDPQGRGFIEGDTAVSFMVQSQLPETVLAQVWDLADLNKDGKLTRDGFAVAMHLINGKLAGREIPAELPSSLIPPSYRTGAQTAPAAPVPPTQSETLRDLWSIEEPVQTPTPAPSKVASPPPVAAAPAPPKPARNLFDDDEDEAPPVAKAGSPAPATATQSIEIANVQNQLGSTQRALESATSARTAAVASSEAAAAELAQLKEQLSRASAARASEENHLAEVRARKAQQDADLAKTREELIHVESQASALRLERGEIEGGVLRDKEELRGVQKRVREVAEEAEKMKAELEKIKREARQVKGLLAIARKQLTTGEGEKAKVQTEVDEAREEVESAQKELEDVERQVATGAAPLPEIVSPAPVAVPTLNGTARVASPPPRTDTLSPSQVELPISRSVTPAQPQRSNSTNPFDRLRNASAGAASPALPFAEVSNPASPFVNTPTGGSAAPFATPTATGTSPFASATGSQVTSAPAAVTSPFGPTPTSSAFDAAFGETPIPAGAETPFSGFEAKPIDNHPPVPVPEPNAHGLADDEDPFGMGADETLEVPDKGKAKEVIEEPKKEEDPEVAAAASQFPALSLQNSPVPASGKPSNDELPPLTEPGTVDESTTDEDSDDEPLDKKAKRLTAQNAAAPTASAFDDAFGLSTNTATVPATGANAFDEAMKESPLTRANPPSPPASALKTPSTITLILLEAWLRTKMPLPRRPPQTRLKQLLMHSLRRDRALRLLLCLVHFRSMMHLERRVQPATRLGPRALRATHLGLLVLRPMLSVRQAQLATGKSIRTHHPRAFLLTKPLDSHRQPSPRPSLSNPCLINAFARTCTNPDSCSSTCGFRVHYVPSVSAYVPDYT
ncbi:calcium binding protein [Ceratobasidium sp. AG-Ba]|nr:calcium binding protein [Ceratobasidium sp. AG-Ba]